MRKILTVTNSTNGLTETIFSVVFRTKLTIALPVESLSADITEITLSEDGSQATVSATVTTWNKWITQEEDGSYTVSSPVNRDYAQVKLVKEDGFWKLLETLSFDKGLDGYDPTIIQQENPTAAESNSQQVSISTSEQTQILGEIEKSEEILSTQYSSFQAARDAVLEIDVEKGNYLALLG